MPKSIILLMRVAARCFQTRLPDNPRGLKRKRKPLFKRVLHHKLSLMLLRLISQNKVDYNVLAHLKRIPAQCAWCLNAITWVAPSSHRRCNPGAFQVHFAQVKGVKPSLPLWLTRTLSWELLTSFLSMLRAKEVEFSSIPGPRMVSLLATICKMACQYKDAGRGHNKKRGYTTISEDGPCTRATGSYSCEPFRLFVYLAKAHGHFRLWFYTSTRHSHYFDSFYAIMNSTELYRFQCNLSFWSWRNKLREPPDEANRNPIRIQKIKGNFIMVVYQPPVLELPVPIGAYRSVNRFVCIATSVVLVLSRMEKKYFFLGTW